MSFHTRPAARRSSAAGVRHLVQLPALAAAAGVMARTAPSASVPAWASSTRLWQAADLDLSVVLPSYNPGPALARTVRDLVAVLDPAVPAFEIVVVSDGSTDGSEDHVEEVDARVRLLRAPANAGKGAALHRGFAASRGAHVAFLDADGDISPDHVVRYWRTAVEGGHDAVYADKLDAGSRVENTLARRTLSWGFQTLIGSFFDLPVRDTQTGCKVFRRDVLAACVPLLHERGFSLDLELFVAATAAGFRDLVGMPVEIGERLAGSTVGSGAVVRTLRESLRILGRLRLGHSYATTPVVPLAAVLELGQIPAATAPAAAVTTLRTPSPLLASTARTELQKAA